MYQIEKLKPDRNFYPALIPFGVLLISALAGFLWGFEVAAIVLAFIFWGYAAYSLIIFIRTHNSSFVVAALFQVSAGLLTASLPALQHNPANKALTILIQACVVFFMVWLFILFITRKMKWRGRDVLELAALPVEDIGNGYTSRPLPAGKTEFNLQQILEFAEFARRNLIAVSYVGKDKVVFVPVRAGREPAFILGLKGDYTDETWVSFDFAGNVSVNISHRDYLEYKESLAFDQLCASLGNLFVEFTEMYLRGEGVRILDRMDALKISVIA
jgi:hypothetical protein